MNWGAVDLAEFVDGDDVPVLQACDGPRFPLEPLAGRIVAREVDVHHLHGDVAFERRVVPAIEDAHAPSTDEVDDVVAPNLLWNVRHAFYRGYNLPYPPQISMPFGLTS